MQIQSFQKKVKLTSAHLYTFRYSMPTNHATKTCHEANFVLLLQTRVNFFSLNEIIGRTSMSQIRYREWTVSSINHCCIIHTSPKPCMFTKKSITVFFIHLESTYPLVPWLMTVAKRASCLSYRQRNRRSGYYMLRQQCHMHGCHTKGSQVRISLFLSRCSYINRHWLCGWNYCVTIRD